MTTLFIPYLNLKKNDWLNYLDSVLFITFNYCRLYTRNNFLKYKKTEQEVLFTLSLGTTGSSCSKYEICKKCPTTKESRKPENQLELRT